MHNFHATSCGKDQTGSRIELEPRWRATSNLFKGVKWALHRRVTSTVDWLQPPTQRLLASLPAYRFPENRHKRGVLKYTHISCGGWWEPPAVTWVFFRTPTRDKNTHTKSPTSLTHGHLFNFLRKKHWRVDQLASNQKLKVKRRVLDTASDDFTFGNTFLFYLVSRWCRARPGRERGGWRM